MLIIAGILGKRILKIWRPRSLFCSTGCQSLSFETWHASLQPTKPFPQPYISFSSEGVKLYLDYTNFIWPKNQMSLLHIDWACCASAATSLSEREKFKAFFPISKLSGNSGFLIIQMKCIWTAGAIKFPPFPVKQERTFQFVSPLKPFAWKGCEEPMFQILLELEYTKDTSLFLHYLAVVCVRGHNKWFAGSFSPRAYWALPLEF